MNTNEAFCECVNGLSVRHNRTGHGFVIRVSGLKLVFSSDGKPKLDVLESTMTVWIRDSKRIKWEIV